MIVCWAGLEAKMLILNLYLDLTSLAAQFFDTHVLGIYVIFMFVNRIFLFSKREN